MAPRRGYNLPCDVVIITDYLISFGFLSHSSFLRNYRSVLMDILKKCFHCFVNSRFLLVLFGSLYTLSLCTTLFILTSLFVPTFISSLRFLHFIPHPHCFIVSFPPPFSQNRPICFIPVKY